MTRRPRPADEAPASSITGGPLVSGRLPRVALIGRPNVGKSTLFNRLVGRRTAIVTDEPGTTRDRREGIARLGQLEFVVVDTAGWEDTPGEGIETRMRQQTQTAIGLADAAIFMIDARAGLTAMDREFARWLRRKSPRTIMVANKCEGRAADVGLAEANALGLGEPIALSAEHGIGLGDLEVMLSRFLAPAPVAQPVEEDDEFADDEVIEQAGEDGDEPEQPAYDPTRPLQLAIVGRPNVGKSTLLNRLLGEDRVVTSPEAGTTRDAIAVEWTYRDRPIRLVDTAGLRKRARVDDRLEHLAGQDTRETIRYAEVVVLVLDATQMMEKQDLVIAHNVIEEGRALVLAVNKVDLLGGTDQTTRQAAWKKLTDRLETSLTQVNGIPIVGFSARTGKGVDALLPAVLKLHETWNKRVATPAFNRWLALATERNPPPMADGRRIRIRFGSQIKIRPPTFALFVSKPAELPESYARYLINRMREDFDMPGTPIRIVMRKRKNPFAPAD